MDLLDAIRNRHTTNGPFADRPVAPEHVQAILEMAARAPSHFNSQPWRFVVIEDAARREALGEIAGDSMRQLMAEGRFIQQYGRFFRFSEEETASSNDGIHFDNVPSVLRPFIKYVLSERSGQVMNTFQVPRVLGNDARKLVAKSPLLIGIALDRSLYRPAELTGVYTSISLGAVVQTIWLTATALGMGMQFVSTPQEIPEQWARVTALLAVPVEYELILLMRLGYEDTTIKRPTIDWRSPQRKPVRDLAFRNEWGTAFELAARESDDAGAT